MNTVYEQQEQGYRFDEEQHIHSLDGRPLMGTTTVLEVISKPLTYWASGMACAEFGWKNPKLHSKEECLAAANEALDGLTGMATEAYIKKLDKAYRAHASNLKKTAVEGTDLHEMIEEFIKSKINNTPLLFIDPKIMPFVEWANKNVKRFLWAEACHYSRRLWVGGKSDFGYEDMEGQIVLGDIKSSKEAYLSHFLQAAGYQIQIEENGLFDENGIKQDLMTLIDYYAIFPFGNGFKEPTIRKDTANFRHGFEAALALYKVKKLYEGE